MNITQSRDLIKDTFTKAFDKAKFREFAVELLNHVDEEKAFARNAQYVKEAFRGHVQRFERLGTYTSPDDEKLDVLIVHLTAGSKLERARTALRNFVADHLKERENKDAALVAFVSPGEKQWRFSFVKMEYATVAKESGKVGVETRFTPARRFSYLVGEGESCHTAQTRFLGLLQETSVDPTLEKIEEAFSVEAVTKEFYREISNWYFWTRECPGVFFPKDVENEEQRALFLIRLLTRLIFCWFLREKKNPQTGSGLIPEALFDVRNIRDLLKDASPESCTYYTAILQNLFFATLNTEMDRPGKKPERRFIDEGDGQRSDEHMVHQLWRHTRQLKDPVALEKLLSGIPFLNGGLFECLDDRVQKKNTPYTVEVRHDGFASDPKKQPKLPNFLFFGAPQEADLSEIYGDTSRRRETISPLLDILNRYNFTLTESTPLDQEVALDPELLGHVFENLLAAYNPETGTVARKATGSFYTPRVVVDWMVDQALLVYLADVLMDGGPRAVVAGKNTDAIHSTSSGQVKRVPPETEQRIKKLFSWEEEDHDFMPAEVEKLIDAIDNLKALDPACGSGAFPMGLLQKLVHVLKKLDPENKGWRRRQEATAEKIESGPAREEALKAITRAFARDNDDYGRKLYLIENCLYGVDIQPIAVQIAKLRFFISLVVDQAIDPNEENYGILPLPNLETKIVAANTLLGLHRGQLLLGSNEVKRLETELQKVRHDYFTARSYKRKKELRKEDKHLCEELAGALESSGECTPYDAKRLSEWNPYDTSKHAPFFDPGWMFGLSNSNKQRNSSFQLEMKKHASRDACATLSGGPFDIVIGNPPYVRQEELKNQTVIGSDGKEKPIKDALKGQYECFTGTADLYVYFFERSLQLLHTGGVLSFITSNKYFRAAYGERLRTYLAYATKPGVVLDFGDAPVFTSIAYPAILVTQKTRSVELGQLPKAGGTRVVASDGDWQSHVMTWTSGPASAKATAGTPDINEFPAIFERNAFNLSQRDLKPDGWQMEGPVNLRLLEKLRKAGTPLGEYVKGRFYRGILTGLNEAFVVDHAIHDQLIAEHPSSKEILKPFLRGRDVKRWQVEFAGQYLIKIESSENQTHPWSGKPEKEAEKIFTKTYPAIHEFFEKMRKPLVKRYDQGKYFWELRSCDYWQEFEQQKIVFPDIALSAQFAWDDDKRYLINTSYILIAAKWILAVANSSPVLWFYKNTSNAIQGGYLRYIRQYVEKIPIPLATPQQKTELEKLVEKILSVKKANPSADVSALESEMDQMVYKLYGLTGEEIAIIEDKK